MNTKEKLELLWKYLLLLVIAVCLFRFSGKPHFKMMEKHFNHGKHEMSFYGDDDHEIDVWVDQEIVDGDTIMKVIVNGHDFFGAIDGFSFFITGDKKAETTMIMLMLAMESLGCHEHGCQSAFHIGCASTCDAIP